jgi:neutral ceramidase
MRTRMTRIHRGLSLLLWGSILCVPGCLDSARDNGASPEETVHHRSEQGMSGVTAQSGGNVFLIGSGIYDITGLGGEITMMGFAVSEQKTAGIHMRLRSRAFVIGDGNRRVVFVSADLGQLFQMVKLKVSEKIAANAELAQYYNTKTSSCRRRIPTAARGLLGIFPV